MTEKKKTGTGLIFSVLTILVTAAGLFLYIQNCKTNYFSNSGVDQKIVICFGVALVLEILMVAFSMKMGAKPVFDIIPPVCGVLTAYGVIQFIGSRIAAAASIMTFENNTQNMADLNGAIRAMIVCAVALICVIFTSFFKVVKE